MFLGFLIGKNGWSGLIRNLLVTNQISANLLVFSIPSGDRSNAVTLYPQRAKKTELRPSPQPTSSNLKDFSGGSNLGTL